jgi:lipopolysaccharide export LptBFGC system permease protein LptF
MQTISNIMAAIVPGILVFTLPISLLIGTLVGLGRLSGDSEIVALGAGGMSRLRMLRPVVLLALIISIVMIYITFNLLPRSIHQLANLKANQSLVFQGLNTEIKPRVFEEGIPQKVLFIEDIDRARTLWHNIFLVDLGDDQTDMKIVTASSGFLRQGERSEMPELYLQQVIAHQTSKNAPQDQERQEAVHNNQRADDERESDRHSQGHGAQKGGEEYDDRHSRCPLRSCASSSL